MIQLEGHYLKDALHRAVVHGLVAGPNILPLLGRFPEQIQPGLEAAIDRGRQPCPSPFLRWQLNAWLVMYLGAKTATAPASWNLSCCKSLAVAKMKA